MSRILFSLITIIIAGGGVGFGIYELTNNILASSAIGVATGWFGYLVTCGLYQIENK